MSALTMYQLIYRCISAALKELDAKGILKKKKKYKSFYLQCVRRPVEDTQKWDYIYKDRKEAANSMVWWFQGVARIKDEKDEEEEEETSRKMYRECKPTI